MCDDQRGDLKEAKVYGAEDRISQLPDDILTQILSFLPTKEVIRTSTLSKRWSRSRLWATMPSLELKASDFQGLNGMRGNGDFFRFVVLFLSRNSPCVIEKFNLVYSDLLNEVFRVELFWSKLNHYDFANLPYLPWEILQDCVINLKPWVHLAQSYKVKELDIDCISMLQFNQVSLVFCRFESLVDLKLSNCMPFSIPVASLCFPKLKTLSLVEIIFKDEYSFPNLINSCCPVLEALYVLSNNIDTDLSDVVITAQTLKHLELEFDIVVNGINIPGMEIYAPALKYLTLINVLITGNDVAGVFGALYEANLDISFAKAKADISSKNDLFSLLRRICNVKELTLSEATLASLNAGIFPMFCILTRLWIVQSFEEKLPCWEVLVDLLKNLPKLESLCFEELFYYMESDFITEDDIPKCLTGCLKTLKMSSLYGHKEEMEMLGYFLKHSRVLEEITVGIETDCPQEREALKKILALPEGSPECEVIYNV